MRAWRRNPAAGFIFTAGPHTLVNSCATLVNLPIFGEVLGIRFPDVLRDLSLS